MGFKREIEELVAKFANEQGDIGCVIDIGCGTKTYSGCFVKSNYFGLDVPTSGRLDGMKRPDVLYDGSALPFASESVDMILCTEVLEHVASPHLLLQEVRRILKDGGQALFTFPFFWGEHEVPYDFWRWTSYGSYHQFLEAGFDHVQVKKLVPGAAAIHRLVVSEIAANDSMGRLRKAIGVICAATLFRIIFPLLGVSCPRVYLTNAVVAKKHSSRGLA